IAPVCDFRYPRVSCALIVAAVLATAMTASPVRAQVQTKAQQKCLNALYTAGGKVGKAQGKVDAKCLKARQGLVTEQLGNPGEEQATDACLTNDVQGQVAKASAAVGEVETGRCVAEPPSFGAGTVDQIAGAGTSQPRAVLRDVFGPNLDQIVINKNAEKAAA